MLKLLNWTLREKPFLYVKKGREKNHGIVLNVKQGRWMLDTDSNVMMIQSGVIFDRIIDQTIAYLARTPNPRETLIFEDIGGQLVQQFGKRLAGAGYCIRTMNHAASLNTHSWYTEALCAPTALIIPHLYWSEFMRNLINYAIETYIDNVLPLPMTIILSHQTATDGSLNISRAVHRNIFFVVKGNESKECKNAISLYADTLIKCGSNNGEFVVLKQGLLPIAIKIDF